MPWLPLDPALLTIGLHIKVDHGWLEHPFVRNTFTISSPSEIAIIRKNKLTRLYYDPDLSHADALAALANEVKGEGHEADSASKEEIAEDERAMRKEKAIHIQQAIDHRKSLQEAEKRYIEKTKQCSIMMKMATIGRAEGIQMAMQLGDSLMEALREQSVALSLVSTERTSDLEQDLAIQALNASAMAFLIGKTLNLETEEIQNLGLGGLLHNIGMNRVPAVLRAKNEETLSPEENKLRRLYPQFGQDILQAIPGGMSKGIIDIVHQHRECLDGSGYPNGLSMGDITKSARVVGTVTEYLHLTNKRRGSKSMTPTQALSHLYVHMKHKYGSDVIEPFIATVTVYPPGTFVAVSDGTIGLVVKSNSMERLRPVIVLYDAVAGHEDTAVIDLSRERALSIKKSLQPQEVPVTVRERLNVGQASGYTLRRIFPNRSSIVDSVCDGEDCHREYSWPSSAQFVFMGKVILE